MVVKAPSAISSGKAVNRSTSVMESRDKSRGVRFNLSEVEEIPEPEYLPSPQPPSSGLRIPRTNLRLSLPAILSPRTTQPSLQEECEDEGDDTRRVSRASISEMLESLESDMENDRKGGKEKIVKKEDEGGMILGGNYLSGGSELESK